MQKRNKSTQNCSSGDTKSSGIKNFVGLDLSLTSTGVAFFTTSTMQTETWHISSKKEDGGIIKELERICKIRDEIYSTLTPYLYDVDDTPLFIIENIAFGIKKTTSVMQLAALNFMVRELVHSHGFPFIVVPPTTLKKFVIGKGVGEKELMLLETYRRWGVAFSSNDECDAYGLARFGEALIDSLSKKSKIILTKSQKETIEVIKPQLYEQSGK